VPVTPQEVLVGFLANDAELLPDDVRGSYYLFIIIYLLARSIIIYLRARIIYFLILLATYYFLVNSWYNVQACRHIFRTVVHVLYVCID